MESILPIRNETFNSDTLLGGLIVLSDQQITIADRKENVSSTRGSGSLAKDLVFNPRCSLFQRCERSYRQG